MSHHGNDSDVILALQQENAALKAKLGERDVKIKKLRDERRDLRQQVESLQSNLRAMNQVTFEEWRSKRKLELSAGNQNPQSQARRTPRTGLYYQQGRELVRELKLKPAESQLFQTAASLEKLKPKDESMANKNKNNPLMTGSTVGKEAEPVHKVVQKPDASPETKQASEPLPFRWPSRAELLEQDHMSVNSVLSPFALDVLKTMRRKLEEPEASDSDSGDEVMKDTQHQSSTPNAPTELASMDSLAGQRKRSAPTEDDDPLTEAKWREYLEES